MGNIDDGANANINIKTSKNVFGALAGDDDDEEDGPKRPKEIKPAMVSKVKGESQKVAVQREVDKYQGKKDGKDSKKKKSNKNRDEDEEDSEEEEEVLAQEDAKKKKKDEKKSKRKEVEAEAEA